MKAIVYSGPHTLELLDVAEPPTPEGYVKIRVRAAGICGSDLNGFRDQAPPRTPPLVMGHEFAGDLPDGRLVAVNPMLACHRCDACVAGLPNLCAEGRLVGVHIDGAFAEYVNVPLESCQILEPWLSPTQGALVEPYANAVHAYNLAAHATAAPLLRIGVIGAGAIGVAVASVASGTAAELVEIAELNSARRQACLDLGVGTVVQELRGTYDAVFDAVGTSATRAASVDLIRPGGAAVWVGLHSPSATLAAQSLVRSEKKILGSFAYTPAEFAAAAAVVGKLRPEWASGRPMVDGPAVFLGLLEDPGDSARLVLTWP